MERYDLIVVGAGASGLMAAGTAAQKGANVLLIEKMFRPGRKLRITGKGRCNLTNLTTIEDFLTHVSHPEFLKPAFENFFAQDLIEFFHSIRIKTKTERGRRVFPQSDKAQDIVDGLHNWVNKSGVTIKTDVRINKIFTKENAVSGVRSNKGKMFFAPKVVLCLGGKSYPKTGSTGDGYSLAESVGHAITNLRPALVPIKLKEQYVARLDRLSLRNVNVRAYQHKRLVGEKFGELQFLNDSISGPVILTLSRELGKLLEKKGERIRISIDLKPALSEEKLRNRFQREIEKLRSLTVMGLLRKLMPDQLLKVFIKVLDIDPQKPAAKLDENEIKKIILLMKDFSFNAKGLKDFDEAIVTSGGVDLKEVNPQTLESKKLKNLFIAGELLDLDADTGGYNLQIAFSTGRLAAESAVRK